MNKKMLFLGMFFVVILFQQCSAQRYEFVIEPSGTKIVKGFFTRTLLETDSTFTWYQQHYNSYELDSATVKDIRSKIKDIHFILVVGTWCGDSKREVPHMFKIMDAAKIPTDEMMLFGVDRTKKSEDGTTDKYRILRVPTLIVFKGEQELGRIVESPRETLEKDLLKILNKQ